MKPTKLLIIVVCALMLSGCSLFGSDDETPVSTAEDFEPTPTSNTVQAAPPATATPVPVETQAALPTAVPIPATPVPPTPTPDRSQPISYVVQSGDVLSLIAEQFDVDIAELRRENDLSGNLIRVGQTLTIPPIAGAAPADTTTETASGTTAGTAAPAPANTPAPVTCPSGSTGHCVQPGDSLSGVASKYGVSIEALRAANPGIEGDVIRIGQLINLPGSGSTDAGTTDTGTTDTGTDTTPTADTVAPPTSDADCAARYPNHPHYHDGQCYANPFTNVTPTPDEDIECPEGYLPWTDGRCYPAPTATAAATPTASYLEPDYGSPPCDDWEEELTPTKCWPKPDATEQQKQDGLAATPTPTATS